MNKISMEELLRATNKQQALEAGQTIANSLFLDWEEGLQCVFKTCIDYPALAPRHISGSDISEVIRKWLGTYKHGIENRPSVRHSELPGTKPDKAVDVVVTARLSNLNKQGLDTLIYGHRLGMSAENVLGELLEEYLAIELSNYGWHCAWGATLRSIDFCHTDGRLLQVKNRSNSENSSSRRVRAGTDIQAWYRIVATTGVTKWPDLNNLIGCTHLSEEQFIEFVERTVKRNPALVAIEPVSPWLSFG